LNKELTEIGYYVYVKILQATILQATDYGIPQIRKRLFVIASKKDIENPFPSPTHLAINYNNLSQFNYLKPCPTL